MPGLPFLSSMQGMLDTGVGLVNLISGMTKHPKFTPYSIPQEYSDMLAQAQSNLNGEMPGYSQMLSNINQNQSNTTAALGRGTDNASTYLNGIMAIQNRTNAGLQNLGVMQEQSYQQRLANLEQAQNIMGQQEAMKWQYNEYMPYMRDLQRKYDLIGGGLQSINNGLGSLGQASFMNSLMGSDKGNTEGSSSLPFLTPIGLQGIGGASAGIPGLASLATFAA